MKKQLMWTSATLKQEDINIIKNICINNTKDLSLSDRFFRFPLHISIKRTYYVEDYLIVKKEIKKLLDSYTDIVIDRLYLYKNKDMLWLRINNENTFIDLHNKLDDLLLDKFNIPIDEFDKNYVPHITLYRDDEDKIDVLYERLKDKLILNDISIDKYALGTSLDNNEFYKGE